MASSFLWPAIGSAFGQALGGVSKGTQDWLSSLSQVEQLRMMQGLEKLREQQVANAARHQLATQKHQADMLAETTKAHAATERYRVAQLAQPMIVPPGSAVLPAKGGSPIFTAPLSPGQKRADALATEEERQRAVATDARGLFPNDFEKQAAYLRNNGVNPDHVLGRGVTRPPGPGTILHGGPVHPDQQLIQDPSSPTGWRAVDIPGARSKSGIGDVTPAERSAILRSNSTATSQAASLLHTLSGLSPDMDRLEQAFGSASFGGYPFAEWSASGAKKAGTKSGQAVRQAEAAANQIISTFDRTILDLKGQRAYKFIERGEATVFSPALTTEENRKQLVSYYSTIASRARKVAEDLLSRADDADAVGAKKQVAPLRRQAEALEQFARAMEGRAARVSSGTRKAPLALPVKPPPPGVSPGYRVVPQD